MNLKMESDSIFIRYSFLKKFNKKKYLFYKTSCILSCPFICCCGCFFPLFLIAYNKQKYLYNINKVLDNYKNYSCINAPLYEENSVKHKDNEYLKTLSQSESEAVEKYIIEINQYKLKLEIKIKMYTCENCGLYDESNEKTKKCQNCKWVFIQKEFN